MADNTVPEQLAEHAFKPGQSGNPQGRPKGARSKLGEDFLKKMLADFEEHGEIVIASVRAEEPTQYLKIVASILPKEITGENGDAIGIRLVERSIVDPIHPNG